ncbi:unnamed protein product [Amoebophrya sp. A120]|nr:unnamed protein product [Amoebophrya sp. A120]|eukprot:GSA120T00017322001.1
MKSYLRLQMILPKTIAIFVSSGVCGAFEFPYTAQNVHELLLERYKVLFCRFSILVFQAPGAGRGIRQDSQHDLPISSAASAGMCMSMHEVMATYLVMKERGDTGNILVDDIGK